MTRFAFALIPLCLALAPHIALAGVSMFATEAEAQQACHGEEVVWVDLDRSRYYHKGQPAFAKGSNGGYACLKGAHAQYREGHE